MTAGYDQLVRLFEMQGSLQQQMGYDFDRMDSKALIEYIRWNVLALEDELHEALNETHWKPWITASPDFKDRERYLGEIVDVTHFLLNLCLAGRITPDELMSAFEGKNARNYQRQEEGYDGTDKCDGPDCRRALDEPGLLGAVRTWKTGERFCSPGCEERRRTEYDRDRAAGERQADVLASGT
jgi:hypothetical protein